MSPSIDRSAIHHSLRRRCCQARSACAWNTTDLLLSRLESVLVKGFIGPHLIPCRPIQLSLTTATASGASVPKTREEELESWGAQGLLSFCRSLIKAVITDMSPSPAATASLRNAKTMRKEIGSRKESETCLQDHLINWLCCRCY